MRVEFRGLTQRFGVLVSGPTGWGEFSPFPDYDEFLAARWAAAASEAASGSWPPARRDRVPVNSMVPAVTPGEAHHLAALSACGTVKVKVGDDMDDARVDAVRAAVGPSGRIRIDVNGAWDVGTAVHKIRSLNRYDLEYVEQPVATIEEMRALRRRIDVPLAADEILRRALDPRRVDLSGAADVAVLKVHPLGGVRAALEVAEAVGLPCVVSSALETSIGLAGGVALAAALPEVPFACGLGTGLLLAGDVVDDPLLPRDGWLDVRRPAVSDDALAPFEAHDAEVLALAARLRAGTRV
jgi:O-succinylbenzoate synthase